jgi:hypothetical protein
MRTCCTYRAACPHGQTAPSNPLHRSANGPVLDPAKILLIAHMRVYQRNITWNTECYPLLRVSRA